MMKANSKQNRIKHELSKQHNMKPDTFSHRLSPRHRFPSVFCCEFEIWWFNLRTGWVLIQFDRNGEKMRSVPVMWIWRWKEIPCKWFNLITPMFMVFHERWLIFEDWWKFPIFSVSILFHQSKTIENVKNVVFLSQLNWLDMIWVVFDFSAHFFHGGSRVFSSKVIWHKERARRAVTISIDLNATRCCAICCREVMFNCWWLVAEVEVENQQKLEKNPLAKNLRFKLLIFSFFLLQKIFINSLKLHALSFQMSSTIVIRMKLHQFAFFGRKFVFTFESWTILRQQMESKLMHKVEHRTETRSRSWVFIFDDKAVRDVW